MWHLALNLSISFAPREKWFILDLYNFCRFKMEEVHPAEQTFKLKVQTT